MANSQATSSSFMLSSPLFFLVVSSQHPYIYTLSSISTLRNRISHLSSASCDLYKLAIQLFSVSSAFPRILSVHNPTGQNIHDNHAQSRHTHVGRSVQYERMLVEWSFLPAAADDFVIWHDAYGSFDDDRGGYCENQGLNDAAYFRRLGFWRNCYPFLEGCIAPRRLISIH